ncbi:MAG: tetratricopeptide repeat protein [Bacteroidota bacterium]
MNIGNIYYLVEEHKVALRFFKESYEYDLELKDTIGMAQGLKNQASCHFSLSQYDRALNHYHQALELIDGYETNNMILTSAIYGGIGALLLEKGDYNKAYQSLQRAIKIDKKHDIKQSLISNYKNLSIYHDTLGNLDSAMYYARSSFEIAQKIKSFHGMQFGTKRLSEVYEKLDSTSKAIDYYKMFVKYRDSIRKDENIEETTRLEVQHQYELQAAKDSIRVQKEKEVLNAEKEWAERMNYTLFGGGALVIVFTVFLYNRYRLIGRQKGTIEQQKEDVERQRDIASEKQREAENQRQIVQEKNKEIIDSIQYASRLQSAILPSVNEQIKPLFDDAFVYYAPKDIVAGDFYWSERVDDVHYIAAADCTGHGVPGAMVSVMCSSALTKALVEENIQDPGQMLDRVRETIIERFEKSGKNVSDGMDISLAAVNVGSNGKPPSVSWAGANNPLWIFRKEHNVQVPDNDKVKVNTEENSLLLQLLPDKQPVGKSFHAVPFNTVTVELQKGDQLYLFSDGYVDQFGGETEEKRQKGGKKLKSKGFRTLLRKIQHLPMEEQSRVLEQNFLEWKGGLEQVDDVCVIGVRL